MGFRFRKSFKIAPGVRLNVGKKSMSVSMGARGVRHSINTKGQRRTSAGIPGTGLYYTNTTSSKPYKTNAYNRNAQLKAQYAEQEKMARIERNQLEVSMFENRLEMIKSIHKESDEPVDWNGMKDSEPPFTKREKGPNEKKAVELLENYKPSFIKKLFNRDDAERQELLKKVEEAKQKDLEDYREWEVLIQLAESVLEGDIDSYFKVIEEFAPLDDLAEFGSGFEFFTEAPDFMEIDFEVHSDSVIPTEIKSLTKTGRLSHRKMPVKQYYDLQQDYVCSCAIRIARDMFSLLPLDFVVIHANDDILDTSTGYMKKQTLLSVKIDRETLNKLNLDLIDCSDAMQNFNHKMNFLKTKGLQPVEKVEA